MAKRALLVMTLIATMAPPDDHDGTDESDLRHDEFSDDDDENWLTMWYLQRCIKRRKLRVCLPRRDGFWESETLSGTVVCERVR
jgi:hypothetical protein